MMFRSGFVHRERRPRKHRSGGAKSVEIRGLPPLHSSPPSGAFFGLVVSLAPFAAVACSALPIEGRESSAEREEGVVEPSSETNSLEGSKGSPHGSEDLSRSFRPSSGSHTRSLVVTGSFRGSCARRSHARDRRLPRRPASRVRRGFLQFGSGSVRSEAASRAGRQGLDHTKQYSRTCGLFGRTTGALIRRASWEAGWSPPRSVELRGGGRGSSSSRSGRPRTDRIVSG